MNFINLKLNNVLWMKKMLLLHNKTVKFKYSVHWLWWIRFLMTVEIVFEWTQFTSWTFKQKMMDFSLSVSILQYIVVWILFFIDCLLSFVKSLVWWINYLGNNQMEQPEPFYSPVQIIHPHVLIKQSVYNMKIRATLSFNAIRDTNAWFFQ